MARGFGRHAPELIAAVAVIAFALALEQRDGRWGLPLDDAWIHLSYARTLAVEGRWALVPGAPGSSGTTGYLWPAILAAELALGLAPVAAAVLPGVVAFILLVTAWRRLASAALAGPGSGGEDAAGGGSGSTLAALSAAGLALSGNLLWLSVSGMEAVLGLFLALLAIERRAAGARGASAAAACLLALTRPEGVVLGAVLAIGSVWAARNRGLRAAAGAGLPSIVPSLLGFAVQLGLNRIIGGSWMPDTLQGRRWLTNIGPDLDLSPATLAIYSRLLVEDWWSRLRDFHFTLGLTGFLSEDPLGPPNLLTAIDGHAGALQIALAGAGLLWLGSAAGRRLLPVAGYALFHTAAYAVMLPSPGHAGRYQPEILLVAAILPALGVRALEALAARYGGAAAAARVGRLGCGLLAMLLVFAAGNAAVWRRTAASASAHIHDLHVNVAEWVMESLPHDARVGGFDIGALAFFGGRPIVDISGLSDPEGGRALHEARMLQFIRKRHATHLVLITGPGATTRMALAWYGLYARRGESEPPLELLQILERSVPYERLWHFALTHNAGNVMRVYEVTR